VLIGRSTELGDVAERIGRSRSVAVVGEAGIGKTALLREAAAAAGRRRFEGGALSSLSWMPYLPLERALARPLPEGDVAAVAAFVRGRVDGGVLLLDDLHWADRETLALIPHLVDRTTVITAVRPDDPGTTAALEACSAAGMETLELGALPADDAERLVLARHPELPSFAVGRIIRAAGGNPFLLEELSERGAASDTLRLSLESRVLSRPAEEREMLAQLGLLGRPVDLPTLGGDPTTLIAAHLVVADGPFLSLRHALLGEVAVKQLTPDEKRVLHARLARALPEPGESARHHFAAGEAREAHEKALKAAGLAVLPGERARHLGLAAVCAEGPQADRLRLDAAAALVEAGFPGEAEELLDAVAVEGAQARAEVALVRARARWFLGDPEGARRAFEAGLDLVAGTRSRVEVRLRIERARLPSRIDWNPVLALQVATEAWDLARATGVEEPRARAILGSAHLAAASPSSIDHLRASLDSARTGGDHDLECTAANSLVTALCLFDDPAGGLELADRMTERARHLNLRGWELQFQLSALLVHEFTGALERGAEIARALLEEPLLARNRDQASSFLARCLAAWGRDEEAQSILEAALAAPRTDATGTSFLLWSKAEACWLAGRPEEARDAVAACMGLGITGFPTTSLAGLMGAWACFELGEPLPPQPPLAPFPALAPVGVELDAVAHLASGRLDAASRGFDRAIECWRGRNVWGTARCLWARGEAARLAGRREEASDALLEAERYASPLKGEALLRKIRRSLRATGIRRSAARRGGGPLTGRERDVMALVAGGLSSTGIARRLGLSRSTVESLIRSAMTKLGARTRLEAAAIVAGEGVPGAPQ
jgi:DNA-binding CsgD family transcriptional regulator